MIRRVVVIVSYEPFAHGPHPVGGLALAHLDASLRDDAAAKAWLAESAAAGLEPDGYRLED
jgi:hypothetical protein